MKKGKLLRLVCFSVLLLFFGSGTVSAVHPAKAIMELYREDIVNENTIEPYIISILALNEVENGRHLKEVKKFIQWYFKRLNREDLHGLSGTIYIYELENGREHSTDKYDSVDGYSGLFLHLLHRYAVKTGDIELLQKNWSKIEDIAYTLPFLQDDDGLTFALPDYEVKYLMDNCESYGGLSAYLSLRSLTGKEKSRYYTRVRASVRNGILTQLDDSGSDMFAWAIGEGEKSLSSWDVFYPDAYAQLFPLYYDILDDEPEVRKRLWKKFTEKYAGSICTFPIEQRIIYELTRKKIEGI